MSERYQIVERIASGGMAEVYRGESAVVGGFRKRVAIRRVLPQLSANSDFINMFLDEARLVQEHVDEVAVRRKLRQHAPDRDPLAEPPDHGALAPVHLGHAAGGDTFDNLVALAHGNDP